MTHNTIKLFDSFTPFVCFSWDAVAGEINYICISEYDDNCINFSDRGGKITRQEAVNVVDLFYSEDFQNDGYIVDVNHYGTPAALMEQEFYSNLDTYTIIESPATIQLPALPSGNYILFYTT